MARRGANRHAAQDALNEPPAGRQAALMNDRVRLREGGKRNSTFSTGSTPPKRGCRLAASAADAGRGAARQAAERLRSPGEKGTNGWREVALAAQKADVDEEIPLATHFARAAEGSIKPAHRQAADF